MRILLLAAALLCLPSASWAWPPSRAYIAVNPAPGYTYTYSYYVQYQRPLFMPSVPQLYVQPVAPAEDTAAALTRLQNEVRLLTLEANVRALQSRTTQTSAPPK